jgi:MoxR-like ATPase
LDSVSAQSAALKSIKDNIEKVIVGKGNTVTLALIALLCGGHVLIEDNPGLGKTKLALSLAKSIGGRFRRIQFTPDLLPSDITGFSMYSIHTGEKTFQPGGIMGNIVLADEINRASPKTQSAMLEVMQEGQVTVDGTTVALPPPFMVIATQNPIEVAGTFALPEAQMDRFFMRLSMGYPEFDNEVEILRRHRAESEDALRPVIDIASVVALQKSLDEIYCHDEIMRYVVRIAEATRTHESVRTGVSPRGSIALMRAAMGVAMYAGRGYVIPDDVLSIVTPVLAHRLILTQTASLHKARAEDVLKSVLKSVPVPVMK